MSSVNGFIADWISQNKDWINQDINNKLQDLSSYLKSDDFAHLKSEAHAFADEIEKVVTALGGPKAVTEDLVAFMAANWALKIITPWARLGWAAGATSVKLARVVMSWNNIETAAGKAKAAQEAALGVEASTSGERLAELGLVGAGVVGAGVATMGLSVWGADQHAKKVAGNDNTWTDPLTGVVMGNDHPDQIANTPRRSWAQMRAAGHAMGRAPVAATDLPPEARGLLRTISSTESHGYGDLYGGGQTTDLSRHPNIPVPITSGPNAGKTSTAAGRYQFLKGTWDAEAAKLGLKDFSPASQDRAAWDDAQGVYRSKTGHDLLTDLRSKDPAMRAGIGTALHSEWTSLPGGIEQGQGGSQFAAALDRNTAAQMAGPAAMGTQAAPPVQMAQAATPGLPRQT